MTDPVFALEPDVPRNLRVARWLIFRMLSGLRRGSVTMREGEQTLHFGDVSAELRAEVHILSPTVYWRVLKGGSLAAAEARWTESGKRNSSRRYCKYLRLTAPYWDARKAVFACLADPPSVCVTGSVATIGNKQKKTLPRITISVMHFMRTFLMRIYSIPAPYSPAPSSL